MQRLPKRLLTKALTTTAADTIYTSPSLTRTTIAACVVTNSGASPKYVSAAILPAGGTAFYICFQRTLQPGESYIIPGAIGQDLDAGDAIEFLAEADDVISLALSGYTVQP